MGSVQKLTEKTIVTTLLIVFDHFSYEKQNKEGP